MTSPTRTTMPPRDLRLSPVTTPPVRDRGRLLTARQIAAEYFPGLVGHKWILEHAPLELRVKVGKRVCYYELEVLAWRDTLQDAAR